MTKTAAVAFLMAVVFAGQAHAFLKPRFPHRTYPPASGGAIYTSEDSIRKAATPAPVQP